MKPARFAYLAPGSVDEATAILGEHGDEARLLAGGQSLGPLLNLRLAQPPIVVDVNRLSSLDYIRVEDDGSLSVGALTRQRRAETSPVVAQAWPLLTEAIGEIGHRAIRNRGTIGGSIAHADPAAELPACLVALGATCRLASSAATRDVAAADFFRGPFSTVLRTGEMLVGITVPGPRPAGTQAWLEFSAGTATSASSVWRRSSTGPATAASPTWSWPIRGLTGRRGSPLTRWLPTPAASGRGARCSSWWAQLPQLLRRPPRISTLRRSTGGA